MVKKENIWKFNDDEWKVHIKDDDTCQKLINNFNLERSTIYYENGGLSEETSWDLIVPNDKIEEIKKFLKDEA